MTSERTIALGLPAFLLLAACTSTKSQSEAEPSVPPARVELEWITVGSNEPGIDGHLVELSDEDLTERGTQVVPDGAADLLPAFLREVETKLSAAWTGEGPVFDVGEGRRRVLELRRVMVFEDADAALEAFPALTEDDMERGPAGKVEVASAKMRFVIIASEDREAMRVGLDRVYVRYGSPELTRLLPLKKPVPVIVSFSIKYVYDNDEITRTILFAETIDATETDYDGGGGVSDWIAVHGGSVPHSVRVGAIGREQLKGVTKALREAGLSILGLASSVRRAGIL